MLYILIQFAAFIGIGVLLRQFKPAQINPGALQKSLISLLYVVFIPALVLLMLWKAPMGSNFWSIVGVMLVSTALTLAAAWAVIRTQRWSPGVKGALLLAAVFGNVVLIGMPVTQIVVHPWTSRTAAMFEAFAVFPVIFTAGVLVAMRFGGKGNGTAIDWPGLVREPVIWALAAGLILNFTGVNLAGSVEKWLDMLVAAIAPLGLIAVGLAFEWRYPWQRLAPQVLIVAGLQLILLPLLLWGVANALDLKGVQTFRSLILQAAMPAAILGFAVCERYKLDTNAYGAAFSATTVLAFVTVPIWLWMLNNRIITL